MITYEKMRTRKVNAELELGEIKSGEHEYNTAHVIELRECVAYCEGAMDALCDHGLCEHD